MKKAKIKILGWDTPQPTFFHVRCEACDRTLGSFNQHKSALAWARAHAKESKHIKGA